MVEKQRISEKICGVILYLLPILFLAACYFLMTVTGEDIWQGAGLKSQYLSRAADAFRYSSRLSDMYAWGVIGAFDYTYSFGPDTVFRALDVLMAFGIVYIISFIGIGRRLKLCIGDALVFNTIFCAIFLNENCEALYVAFSNIHNYLIIGLFSMLFFVPFARKAQGVSMSDGWRIKLCMMLLGFLFGLSSNVTPIVFLISFGICLIIWFANMIYSKRKIDLIKLFTSWEFFAVLGVVFACVLMYVAGSGYSVYISDEYMNATDYVSFGDIFSNPTKYIPKTLNHIYENIREMFPCIILMVIALLSEMVIHQKNKQNNDSCSGVYLAAGGTVFVVMHVFAMSQVNILSLIRLAMPAYFVSVSIVCFSVLRLIKQLELKKIFVYIYSIVLISVSGAMIVDVSIQRYEYSRRIEQVIDAFEKTENDFYYIPYSMIHIEESPIFGFEQYRFLHEWTAGQVQVCGKTAYINYDN